MLVHIRTCHLGYASIAALQNAWACSTHRPLLLPCSCRACASTGPQMATSNNGASNSGRPLRRAVSNAAKQERRGVCIGLDLDGQAPPEARRGRAFVLCAARSDKHAAQRERLLDSNYRPSTRIREFGFFEEPAPPCASVEPALAARDAARLHGTTSKSSSLLYCPYQNSR